ncbi:hypothetical protein [Clostridium saccharoperbutylacetonicum]|uniref:hypothetical protein n=1 Tax=Clostridium saccharoperbutylacetonicum TaxID=36745 RepID=UPI0039EABE36
MSIDTKLGDVPSSTLSDTSNVIFTDGENVRKEAYASMKADMLGTATLATNSPKIKEGINELVQDLLESTGYGVVSGGVVSSQSTPNMTANVTGCTLKTSTGARQVVGANAALVVTTADTTNPRKDIVYVDSTGVAQYLQGIAALSPTAPVTPSGGFLLAEIYVAANATSITNSNITDKRKMLISTDTLNTLLSENTQNIAKISNPNLLINEDFLIYQRSSTGNFSIPSTDTVTVNKIVFDRWSLGRQTTDYTVSAVKTDDGIYITSDAVKRMILGYALDIDLVKRLRNKNLTFSFDIKKDSSWNVGMLQVKAYIGENVSELRYDPTNRIVYYKDVQYADIGAEYTRVTFTFPIKATATNVSILFDTSGINSSGGTPVTINANAKIYLRNIKLELGDKATPFVPRLYGEELALCQRYYEVGQGSSAAHGCTQNIAFNNSYRAIKRIVPTLATHITGANGLSASYQQVGASLTTWTNYTTDFSAYASVLNPGVANQAQFQLTWTSDAEIY